MGLKVFLQSPQLVELRDQSNFALLLQQNRNPSQLSKGYSPILSFRVEHFDEVHSKLLRWKLIPDGDILSTPNGKLATFQGPEGETLSINNFP